MDTIQVAISDASYAESLREVLLRNGGWEVLCLDRPDSSRGGVMVLDTDHLAMLPRPLPNPERVVLIARNESDDLTRAWEAGINSVIKSTDPLNTAVLAIMAARLRATVGTPAAQARPSPGSRQAGGERGSSERPWKPQG